MRIKRCEISAMSQHLTGGTWTTLSICIALAVVCADNFTLPFCFEGPKGLKTPDAD